MQQNGVFDREVTTTFSVVTQDSSSSTKQRVFSLGERVRYTVMLRVLSVFMKALLHSTALA